MRWEEKADPRLRLRRMRTTDLTGTELVAIRRLMEEAFATDEEEAFTDDDWEHAIGGLHFVLDLDGEIVTHASVVQRALQIGERSVATGYVEAVATARTRQGAGHGTRVMRAVTDHIRDRFDLGGLGTGRHQFYERLGWQGWRGPAFVRTPAGLRRTPDEEGYILVLRTPTSPAFDLTEPLSCEWRDGDVW